MYRHSRLALAAFVVTIALTACGAEDKQASPRAPAAEVPLETPAAKAPPADGPSPAKPATPPASSAIGKIDALEGEVHVVDSRGARRVQAGTEVLEGDTVRVGPDAWALLAMADGATLTVRSDSELRLDTYRYAPDGEASENSAAISLAKGALRSITGYIGQVNPVAYKVTTPTATIGIRGTDHEPAYYPPAPPGVKQDHAPGTYDKVNEGETVIRRPAGEVVVRRGQTAFAHQDIKIRPQVLAKPPVFYQQHAQLDTRAADRRAEFRRVFEQQREQQRERRLQERRQQDAQKKAQEPRLDRKAPAQQDQQKDLRQQQRDDQKKKQDERKAQQDKERTDRKAQQDKERADRQKKGTSAANEKKAAKDEKKAPLPPSVAERIKGMQGGDRTATQTPKQQQQSDQRQQSQQRTTPQQRQQSGQETPRQQRRQQDEQPARNPLQEQIERLQQRQQPAQPQRQQQQRQQEAEARQQQRQQEAEARQQQRQQQQQNQRQQRQDRRDQDRDRPR